MAYSERAVNVNGPRAASVRCSMERPAALERPLQQIAPRCLGVPSALCSRLGRWQPTFLAAGLGLPYAPCLTPGQPPPKANGMIGLGP
jgi:hypothetical protein